MIEADRMRAEAKASGQALEGKSKVALNLTDAPVAALDPSGIRDPRPHIGRRARPPSPPPAAVRVGRSAHRNRPMAVSRMAD